MRFFAAFLGPLLLSLGTAHAGAVVFPGTWTDGAFQPPAGTEKGAFHAVPVLYSAITASMQRDGAKVRVEETLVGTPDTAHVLLVPLPKGTVNTSATVFVDGQRVAGQVLDPRGAQTLYTALAAHRDVSRLMAFADQPVFVANGVQLKLRSVAVTELTYPIQDGAMLDGLIPMPVVGLSPTPLRRVTVDANISDAKPLRAVFSPSHDIEVERPDVHTARVRFQAENLRENGDLRLLFATDDDALGLRVLTHRPEGSEHGWFMLLGNPTGGDGVAPQPKDVVLAVDTSGSMRGEKLGQVQLAVEYVINRLGAEDRVNIIAFGSAIKRFRPDVVPANDANRAAARAFVRGLLAEGKTNISEALKAGLAGKKSADRPRMMLFLTDGAPTAGEMNPEKITAMVPTANQSQTRVFAIGVGHEVNAHLLDTLARDTAGRSVYFKPDDEIDVQVAALYDSISHPVLTDVALDFGGLSVEHTAPSDLGALFRGQEVLVLGRYTGGGEHTFKVKGSLRGQPLQYSVTADFPKAARVDDAFIAWIWASRRIGDLLAEIRLKGRTQERIAEVVQLSRQFGIITEYTLFISQADKDYSLEEAQKEAANLMEQANRNASGRWAFNQADNDQRFANRKVSSAMSNVYFDRQGKRVQAQKVKTVGGRTFYQREGKWVQSGSTAKKRRRVKKFSPEYFDLVRQNKDFAQSQFEDANTVMDVGDTTIETY
jgi:Ca-activated chloride channel family protein